MTAVKIHQEKYLWKWFVNHKVPIIVRQIWFMVSKVTKYISCILNGRTLLSCNKNGRTFSTRDLSLWLTSSLIWNCWKKVIELSSEDTAELLSRLFLLTTYFMWENCAGWNTFFSLEDSGIRNMTNFLFSLCPWWAGNTRSCIWPNMSSLQLLSSNREKVKRRQHTWRSCVAQRIRSSSLYPAQLPHYS